ncbi:MAG: DUF3533 domain-containing protein [Actinobacteria bacterium]|nr:DUF3533 domain-containing protein [Actinomycetota bacterium]
MSTPTVTAHRDERQPAPEREAGERAQAASTKDSAVTSQDTAGGKARLHLARRPWVLALLVLGLQLTFTWSYVGALHDPVPKALPLGVVAPETVVTALNQQLQTKTDAVTLVPVADEAAARAAIADRKLYGAVVVAAPPSTRDKLVVSAVPSALIQQVYQRVLDGFEPQLGRSYDIEIVNAFSAGDPRGLTPFYLALGWLVGGYLLAALLGFTQPKPRDAKSAARRVVLLALYSLASGIGGVVLIGPVLGIWSEGLLTLGLVGALLVFGVSSLTTALDMLFGPVIGTGLAIFTVVVLGNPSAGGAFPREFLPSFWQQIGPYLPPGLGTDAIRDAVYFGGQGIGGPVSWLAVYAGTALAGIAVITWAGGRRTRGLAHESGPARQPND